MILTDSLLEDMYNRVVTIKHKIEGTTPPSPIPPPALTTYDGMLEAIADTSHDALVSLAKNKGYEHNSVEFAYTMTLPAKLYEWGGLQTVGGRTIIWNQLSTNNSANPDVYTNHSVTYTFNKDDLTVTCTGTATDGAAAASRQYAGIKDHVYLMTGCPAGGSTSTYYVTTSAGGSDKGDGSIFTETTTGTRYIIFRFGNGYNSDGIVFRPLIFDLTMMFGAGNEPATVAEFKSIFPADYYAPETTGVLMSAGVTKINDYAIPADVQTMTGYGWSCPGALNYIDFENQKYVQEVGSRAYASGDESDATVITDKTTTHYKLTTPVETTISVDDPVPDAGPGDTITFENNLGDGYKIPVPVLVEYVGR